MSSFAGFIKQIHLEKNLGLSSARNEGIKQAIGRYVINLDADDYVDDNLLLVESIFLTSMLHGMRYHVITILLMKMKTH